MSEQLRETSATRSAYLELRDERRFVLEGYEFLDEKRVLLAAELLRQLADYQRAYDRYSRLNEEATNRLRRAIARHGLDGLAVYPPLHLVHPELDLEQQTFLGVQLQIGVFRLQGSVAAWEAVNPSPEAQSCATTFHTLLAVAVQLAVVSGNLYRLCDEYIRTEHRARALENVIIPEIDTTLRMIDEQLETIEQEDVLRVRFRK